MKLNFAEDNIIIIAPQNWHFALLKEFRTQIPFGNVKFFTKEELLNRIYGAYDNKAIIYLINKYNYNYEMATTILRFLPFSIPNINEKINRLWQIKNELIDAKLLHVDEFIKILFKQKSVYAYGYGACDVELKKIAKDLNITINYVDFSYGKYLPIVHVKKDINKEIFHVFNLISHLLMEGIKQSDIILIANANDYQNKINQMCDQFNWPKLWPVRFSYLTLPKVIAALKDIEENGMDDFLMANNFTNDSTIKEVCEIIKTNDIISINSNEQRLDFLKSILRKTYLSEDQKTNITILENIPFIEKNKYYFILGFNQGNYPFIKKDDDYLLNSEKETLNYLTSFNMNHVTKNNIISFLSSAKHLYITFPLSKNGEKVYPSSLISELNLEIEESEENEIYSEKEAQRYYGELLDYERKFNYHNPLIDIYKQNYKIPYLKYDNRFNGLSNYKYSPTRNYSYSKIKSFFECQFRYYLIHILHLEEYEETFSQKVGLLFHNILSEAYNVNFNFDSEYQKKIQNYEFNVGERLILERKKDELKFLCKLLKEHQQSMNFRGAFYENSFQTKLNNEVIVNGQIDKIIITFDEHKEYYSIVDYKTGSETFDKKMLPYGFSMQLPTYALLVKNNANFIRKELIGFYIQKVTIDEIGVPLNEFESFFRKHFYLMGLSTSDLEKIKTFDYSYANSLYIKSYSVNSENVLSHFAKVATSIDFDNIIETTKKNYLLADQKIKDGEFIINPKIFDNNRDSTCKYCNFKDICNVTFNDYVHINTKDEGEQ